MSKAAVLLWRHIFESGDAKRLRKQVQDLSDLRLIQNTPYLKDGDRGHLLDIYEKPDLPGSAPVLLNIHGGGLFASYKEVNANFNYEWARLGYRVVSLSYRRIPETTLRHQVEDVMTALRYLSSHAGEHHLNLDRCVLTGDSAGALLCLFALGVNGSPALQEVFGIAGAEIPFRAAGFVSIMLDTQRRDLMWAISNVVTGREDRGKPYERYLLNPAMVTEAVKLPPTYLVTSAEDLIRKDTLKLDRILSGTGVPHVLLDFPKGTARKLVHVFPVCYPMYPESREVFSSMDHYFQEALR